MGADIDNSRRMLTALQTAFRCMHRSQRRALDMGAFIDTLRDWEGQRINVQQQQDVNMENSVIQESVHIHNKGIFDALNESLMKFRPYGIQGEPMPWSNKVRRL